MGFKIMAEMIKTIGAILLFTSCINTSENNQVLGNWKSIETERGPKFQTELFIDEETFNVFSEEVNDIIFSSYYRITNDEIVILEDNKKDIEFTFKYVVSDKGLRISGGEINAMYTKIPQGKTMDEYLYGDMTKSEYITEFKKRKFK